MNEQLNWYVLYTRPNNEKKVFNELNKRDITTFLPTKKVTRKWSDREKKIEVPLFPNYLFVKVPTRQMWLALTVNGVLQYITFDGTPVVVKETDVAMVKKLLTGGSAIRNEECCVKGDKVKVSNGPLAGLYGMVTEKKGLTRLYVELEAIQRVISVDIDAGLLEKVK